MRLYNTLTRTEEPFAPADGRTVRMYTCGLTVYARGHIGNFRTFVTLDVLRRALKYQEGYALRQVTNFTDVDDKTIKASAEAGVPLREYTTRYVEAFLEDADRLGLERAEVYPRATDEENLRAMVEMIRALEARGHTYQSDGSVYFRVDSFEDYGRLARLDHEGIQPGARVDSDTYAKQDARDFVLWKAARPGEPSWDFGVGAGRPGWHIECSAMALRLLGEPPIDIHGGGIDLVFPHHENEIAQAEGATGRPFARHWVHVEFLNLEHEKMAKSRGNVYTLPDVIARGYRPSALRYLLLSAHYRKQLTFTWEGVAQAEAALTRLTDFLARLETAAGAGPAEAIQTRLDQASADFRAMIADDLNVPAAMGVLFDLVREMNALLDQGQVDQTGAARIRETVEAFDRVLGVIALRQAEDAAPPLPIDEIERLIAERREARRARDFARADAIRRDLESRGILLEDTATATRWKRGSKTDG
jgi:cysteinyl-tRNA synthetase